MASEVGRDIRMYAAMMEDLPLYDYWLEASNALVWRDGIHDALAGGASLTTEERALLEKADVELIKHRDELVRRFPEVFEDRAPREYWWWHLEKELPEAAKKLVATQDTNSTRRT